MRKTWWFGQGWVFSALAVSASFGAGACGLDSGSPSESIGSVGQALPTGTLLGLWHFDDCRNNNQVLDDSSGNGFEAVRSTTAKCGVGPGDDGTTVKQAVAFNEPTDVITVANEPAFELET